MIDLVSVDNMRSSDRITIDRGTPSLELMRRAGLVLYKSLSYKGNVSIVTGKGNNGGDGFALACFLAGDGFSPIVYTLSDELSDDAYYFYDKAKKMGVLIREYVPHLNQLSDSDIIVDALLGTGFHGEVEGIYKDCIEEINSYRDKFILSVDINSGVSGDYGPSSLFVRSSLTVTIQAIKKGMLIDNKSYLSHLVIGDIGVSLSKKEDIMVPKTEFDSLTKERTFTEDGISYFYKDSRKVYCQPEWLRIEKVSYLG